MWPWWGSGSTRARSSSCLHSSTSCTTAVMQFPLLHSRHFPCYVWMDPLAKGKWELGIFLFPSRDNFAAGESNPTGTLVLTVNKITMTIKEWETDLLVGTFYGYYKNLSQYLASQSAQAMGEKATILSQYECEFVIVLSKKYSICFHCTCHHSYRKGAKWTSDIIFRSGLCIFRSGLYNSIKYSMYPEEKLIYICSLMLQPQQCPSYTSSAYYDFFDFHVMLMHFN